MFATGVFGLMLVLELGLGYVLVLVLGLVS